MNFFLQFVLIPWTCAVLSAAAAAPLGSIISWRRLIYFGEALAHSAWLGIALALYFRLPIYLGIWGITALLVILLYVIKRRTGADGNNILGTLSHFMLALGVIALSKMENIRTDLFGYLFGDILNAGGRDLLLIAIATVLTLLFIKWLWQPLILLTVSEDIARTEIPNVHRYEGIFLLLLGLFTGIMIQFIGLMLVMAFLIIPIQTTNRFAHTPEQCVLWAAILSTITATLGVGMAYLWDFPVAPAIVGISGICYFAALCYQKLYFTEAKRLDAGTGSNTSAIRQEKL